MPWRYKICIAKCLYPDGDNLLKKIWSKSRPKIAKLPLPVDARRSKTSLFKLPVIIPHQEIITVLLWLLPAHVTSSFSKISDFIWKEKEHFWKAGFAASLENNDLFLNKTDKCGLGLKKGQSSLLEKPCYFRRKQNKSLCRTVLSPKLLINIISIINININKYSRKWKVRLLFTQWRARRPIRGT